VLYQSVCINTLTLLVNHQNSAKCTKQHYNYKHVKMALPTCRSVTSGHICELTVKQPTQHGERNTSTQLVFRIICDVF